MWAETLVHTDGHAQAVISIHSARVGGDPGWLQDPPQARTFQSTPPVWAETHRNAATPDAVGFQSTPPVWAETIESQSANVYQLISIHSARVGGDHFSV